MHNPRLSKGETIKTASTKDRHGLDGGVWREGQPRMVFQCWWGHFFFPWVEGKTDSFELMSWPCPSVISAQQPAMQQRKSEHAVVRGLGRHILVRYVLCIIGREEPPSSARQEEGNARSRKVKNMERKKGGADITAVASCRGLDHHRSCLGETA